MRAFIAVYEKGHGSGTAIALDAARVVEVVGAREWSRFPEGRAHVVGVMAWKGSAIGVLDIGVITGLFAPLGERRARSRAPILFHNGLTAALPVDAVREAISVADELVTAEERAPFCREVVELDGQRVPVFDVEAALEACRLRRDT